MSFAERLILLVETSRLTELEFADGGTRVRIARQAAAAAAANETGHRQSKEAPNSMSSGKVALAAAATASDDPADPADHVVCAGMLGTFFRAPGPGEAPFVSEGDLVQEGQTLAILEAMKVLNPVEADRSGRILRILVEDGASVRALMPLFTMSPST